MKYLRVTGRPSLEAVPEAYRVIAASEHASEARLLGWDVVGGGEDAAEMGAVTLLYDVDGDAEGMAAALRDAPATGAVEVAATGTDRFHLLVDLRPSVAPMLREVFVETLTRDGLVVVTPLVYRDGEVHARLVGRSAAVQGALDGLPDAVAVTVHEVGEAGPLPGAPADALSDRQREAVEAALALGYYDRPRDATHAEVAAALDCAPSTASEHLRKAEAKLVRAALPDPG